MCTFFFCTYRKCLDDKDHAVQSMVSFESRYREVVRHFSSVFEVSDISFGNSVTDIVSRVSTYSLVFWWK